MLQEKTRIIDGNLKEINDNFQKLHILNEQFIHLCDELIHYLNRSLEGERE